MAQWLDRRSIKSLCRHCAAFSFCREVVELAATRLIALHKNKGKSVAACLKNRTEITLHKAAKAAFDEANLKTLPKVKELDAEYSKLLTEKKARYPDYRKAKEEMQELLRAQKNIALFFDEEKNPEQTEHSR